MSTWLVSERTFEYLKRRGRRLHLGSKFRSRQPDADGTGYPDVTCGSLRAGRALKRDSERLHRTARDQGRIGLIATMNLARFVGRWVRSWLSESDGARTRDLRRDRPLRGSPGEQRWMRQRSVHAALRHCGGASRMAERACPQRLLPFCCPRRNASGSLAPHSGEIKDFAAD